MAVGILAYGSLITDPGCEIAPLIRQRLQTTTPFKVEFARKSTGRGDAPTLVPVESGGAYVKAQLLVLDACISREVAADMLYRRETDRSGTVVKYPATRVATANAVLIQELPRQQGADVILYAKLTANLDDPTPPKLAKLAVASARTKVGEAGRDGITYLRDAKAAGIRTPLMAAYEAEVLRLTRGRSLSEAVALARGARRKRGAAALRTAAGVVTYEYWMFHQALAWLAEEQKRENSNRVNINAAIEIALIHARNFLEFFATRTKGKREADDVRMEDFLLSPPRVSMPYLRGNRKRIQRKLAHMSYSNSRMSSSWEFRSIAAEIDDALRVFLKRLQIDDVRLGRLFAGIAVHLGICEGVGSSVRETGREGGSCGSDCRKHLRDERAVSA